MRRNALIFLVLIILVLVGAYWYGQQHHTTAINDNSSIQTVVYQFGSTLQKVLLATSTARDNIAAAYSPYVAAPLVAQWQADPLNAPGRGTSSPWPDRIQIDSMTQQPDGSYIVKGSVIEITSNEVTHGGVAASYTVTMTLKKSGDQWLITALQRGAEVKSPK